MDLRHHRGVGLIAILDVKDQCLSNLERWLENKIPKNGIRPLTDPLLDQPLVGLRVHSFIHSLNH